MQHLQVRRQRIRKCTRALCPHEVSSHLRLQLPVVPDSELRRPVTLAHADVIQCLCCSSQAIGRRMHSPLSKTFSLQFFHLTVTPLACCVETEHNAFILKVTLRVLCGVHIDLACSAAVLLWRGSSQPWASEPCTVSRHWPFIVLPTGRRLLERKCLLELGYWQYLSIRVHRHNLPGRVLPIQVRFQHL